MQASQYTRVAAVSIGCRHACTLSPQPPNKGAITSKIKHAIKLKTSPARLAQLLHNCCSPQTTILSSGKTFVNIITIKLESLLMLLMDVCLVWAMKILLNVGEHTSKSCITVIMTVSPEIRSLVNSDTALLLLITLVLLCNIS